MGLDSAPLGTHVYVDANIFLYVLEDAELYASLLHGVFRDFATRRRFAITSALTWAEVLIVPFREADLSKIERVRNYFLDSDVLTLVDVSTDLLVRAAQIRAGQNLRLPDAIHVATAEWAGCESFLTNDKRLRSRPEVQGVILSDYLVEG